MSTVTLKARVGGAGGSILDSMRSPQSYSGGRASSPSAAGGGGRAASELLPTNRRSSPKASGLISSYDQLLAEPREGSAR